MKAPDPSRVKETIRSFIARSVKLDGLEDDADLFESGLVNSLFAMQLMTFLERTFGIVVGPADLEIENFKSINATAAFVVRKSGGGPAGQAGAPSPDDANDPD